MKNSGLCVLSLVFLLLVSVPVTVIATASDRSDTCYEYGFGAGMENTPLYNELMKILDLSEERDAFMERAEAHAGYLREYHPELYQRYHGLAESLSADVPDVVALSLFLPAILFRGCTTSASAPPATDGGVYLTWNLDLWPLWGLKQAITLPPLSVVSIPGKNRYMIFGVPLVAGIGLLNDKGLALVGNACGTTDDGEGLTALEISTIVMEECSNVEEAAALIEGLDRFSSSGFSLFNLNYLFADAEGGICSIEATHNYFHAAFSGQNESHTELVDGELLEVVGQKGMLAQGNHHQYLDFNRTGAPSSGPDGYESSWIRANRMWDLLRENYGGIDLEKAMSFTKDRANGVSLGPFEQGGYNSICRTEFPLGYIDYYLGSLSGKYVAGGTSAWAHDMYVLGPDQTDYAFVIEPQERIIWWAAGWPTMFDYHPIRCGELLGEGTPVSSSLGLVDSLCNRWVRCYSGSLNGALRILSGSTTESLSSRVNSVLKRIANAMK